ncbi:MAG: hypothetical protein KAW12_29695 [Candidatus Aminicenantes bacterium]|nr:hypothetical protein [Candidatus Aminicenantes bacterium]
MKKTLKLTIPVFVLVIAAAVLVFGPKGTGALNPNHDCSICHNTHSAPGQALTNNAVATDMCLSCHGAAGSSSLKAEVHLGSTYGAFEMGCIDCHNPHDNVPNWRGGTNIKMIGADLAGSVGTITTPNSGTVDVVFESRGTDASEPSLYSFADGDEDGDGTYDNVCEVCHTQVSHHRNSTSGGDHTHYVGQTCTDCHPHDGNFAPSGGGSCTGCHSTAQGSRRAVVGEFSLASHHVLAGAVTSDDCGVCHYEPLDMATYHNNGDVDLMNPDTGARLTGFTSFTRNTSSASLESWVTDIQDNHCMKCHDSDGATFTNFSGNALRPFSSGAKDVPNTFAQFDTGNTYHHAVRGTVGNSFCNSATMVAPWDSGGPHVISCFDCHVTSGHGSSNQRMLLTAIDLDTMESGTPTNDTGISVETFCVLCHKASEYQTGSNNSKFEFHGSNQNQHRASGGNELGCLGCHGGIVNYGLVPNGTARGNIHGGSFTWPSGTWSAGSVTPTFMVGGWNSGWEANTSAGKDGCGGGDCNHPGRADKGTPGKEYTQIAD